MDLNFNSMSSYNDKSSVANSLIFYLYHKHKKQNLYYKSVNSIQGLYKDPILKEYIYISSNGLKKNAVFKRSEINENVLSPKINIFISYFSNIEDNLFKFNLYPQKYFKDVAKHYFNQRQIIIQCQKKLLNLKIPKLKSKFLTNYIALCNIRRQTVFGGFDKLLIVKSLYQKVIVTTTTGFLKDVTLNFSERIIFTGLTYILKKNMKEAFVNILMLNYLLLKYYSNTYLN